MTHDALHTYQYDAENRIISVDGATTYTYDGDGRRIKKCNGSSCSTGTVYWRSGETVAESDLANNWTTSFINSGGSPLARVDLLAGSLAD